MRIKPTHIFTAVLVLVLIAFFGFLVSGSKFNVLEPAGFIAAEQRVLLITTVLLSLIVVIPVFTLTAVIAWKYRASNKKAKYQPEWDHSTRLEAIWWGVPCAIILVLAVITWQSSHALDPSKPLVSATKPLTVQVVALPWKWLFIYPEYGIASVNYLQFPENTPVSFKLTADAPMNSFWIPQLGGQVYAMAGMSTRLQLIADKPGTYNGSSANLSGKGFAGMRFKAESSTKVGFDYWVQTVKNTQSSLNTSAYEALAKPSIGNNYAYYSVVEPDLYDTIINKYKVPKGESGIEYYRNTRSESSMNDNH